MTQEEKAKRYDEAIKIAKNTIEVNQTIPDIVECVKSLFPELKESEDEKKINEIISYFNSRVAVAEETELLYFKRWIAWLEKQGQTFTKKDIDDAYLKGICDAKHELEKQVTPQTRTGDEWVNMIDDACDKRYSEEYARGEYCHEQSFKWGFQEGVEWLEKQGEHANFRNKIQIGDKVTHNENGVLVNLSQLKRVAKPAVTDFNAKDWYVSKVDGKIHDMTYNPADKVEPKFKKE